MHVSLTVSTSYLMMHISCYGMCMIHMMIWTFANELQRERLQSFGHVFMSGKKTVVVEPTILHNSFIRLMLPPEGVDAAQQLISWGV